MKNIILLFLLFSFSQLVLAQQNDNHRVIGELIIHFDKETKTHDWLINNKEQKNTLSALIHIKKLGIRHNIHHFSFDETSAYDAQRLLDAVQSSSEVLSAQFNYRVSSRNMPNDDLFSQQWDMDIINASQAWETTTGGQTPSGTRIVVANMDSGFEFYHEDLNVNLWHNPGEILGDSIDNDSNGYIDDDIGWDYYNNSPVIVPGNHGTSTAGIIGAKGNNGIGVTGVNWDVDLMLFSFPNLITDLIRSYEYIIDQRARFNESLGNEGAFVVAANASFGVNMSCCELYPTWAEMFDLMGEVGILTSSGVANSPYDADAKCDMPASCPSEYLVISCNTDMDDNLDQTSAYGATLVDIGSPGKQSYTTKASDTYGTFGGNSAATPHVTGAIALLYSAPFDEIEQMAIQQPQQAALMIRDYIIDNVTPLPSLDGMTVTGGRLNLGQSMNAMLIDFDNILGDLQISNLYPNPSDKGLTATFLTPENGDYYAEIYNTAGQYLSSQTVPVGLTGLRTFYLKTDHIPSGSYILKFGKQDSWVVNQFVVIR